jgi:hypothetical protein
LVDLLRRIHDEGYDRIVVVAHSLGGYIAYDALTSLWAQMHELNAGGAPDPPRPGDPALAGLPEVEQQAEELLKPLREREAAGTPSAMSLPFAADADDTGKRADVIEYQRRQFEMWKGLRRQGNPWRITDFLTVGTPMTFADLLMTKAKVRDGFGKPDGRQASCGLFGDMMRRGDLVRCPPRSESRTVEDRNEPRDVHYGWRRGEEDLEVLGSQSVFAPVRWTNLWFPVTRGSLHGDWFGRPLRPLFGPGIRDIRMDGNLPGRLARAVAHTYYFKFDDDDSEGSVAHTVRKTLALGESYDSLVELRQSALPTDPSTGGELIEGSAADPVAP